MVQREIYTCLGRCVDFPRLNLTSFNVRREA